MPPATRPRVEGAPERHRPAPPPWARLTSGPGGYGTAMSGTVVAIVIASILTGGGVLAWLGLLLWAARRDGQDQRERDRRASWRRGP